MIITLVSWIIFGALVGWISSMLIGPSYESTTRHIITGVVGSLLGGIAVKSVTNNSIETFTVSSLIVSTLGAMVLLAFFRGFTRT